MNVQINYVTRVQGFLLTICLTAPALPSRPIAMKRMVVSDTGSTI